MEVKKITMWQIATGILGVLLIVSIFTSGFGGITGAAIMSEEEAVEKAITYINENMVQPGATAELKEAKKENGLYAFKIELSGKEYDSYVTTDGRMLFTVSAVDLDKLPEAPAPAAAPADMQKSAKPEVEIFVMSHCPFGTQIEKGIIPVVKLLGDKIDFKLRFVNYAMHGEKEVTEQTNQYCIAEEQNSKLIPYLECFLADGDTDRCLTEAKIDKAKLDACVAKADKEFSLTKNLEDKESWLNGRFPKFAIHDELNVKYGVTGSPGLVINGAKVSSARSPAALLTTICNAFEDTPSECDETLDEANPAAGFGYEPAPANAGSAGACG